MVIRGINLIKTGADIGYVDKIGGYVGTPFGQASSGASSKTPTVQSPAGVPAFTPAAGGAGSGISLPTSVLIMPKVGSAINAMGSADVRGREYAGSITVNIGVAGDPEATARVITETLNDSYYRGTGGATNFRINDR